MSIHRIINSSPPIRVEFFIAKPSLIQQDGAPDCQIITVRSQVDQQLYQALLRAQNEIRRLNGLVPYLAGKVDSLNAEVTLLKQRVNQPNPPGIQIPSSMLPPTNSGAPQQLGTAGQVRVCAPFLPGVLSRIPRVLQQPAQVSSPSLRRAPQQLGTAGQVRVCAPFHPGVLPLLNQPTNPLQVPIILSSQQFKTANRKDVVEQTNHPQSIQRPNAQSNLEYTKELQDKADHGAADAQLKVGLCYAEGIGIERNPSVAADYFKRSAELGLPEAQYKLGLCYEQGEGRKQKLKKAFKNYEDAASQEHAGAQYKLGKLYEKGRDNLPSNPKEAIRYYQRAADQGFSLAQYKLGWCFARGFGGKQNKQEAVRYYTMAAANGNAEAQFKLGCCFERGFGTPKDIKEAIKHYRAAANQKHEEAQRRLNRLLKNAT